MAGYDKERNEMGKSVDLAISLVLNSNQAVLKSIAKEKLDENSKSDLLALNDYVPRLAKRLYKFKTKILDDLKENEQ
jgi:hypothetical protein